MDASKTQTLKFPALSIHTVELLEQALAAAVTAGYRIREEMTGGRAGVACVIRGQKHLFIDPAAPPRERLEQVVVALRVDPAVANVRLSDALRRVLDVLKAS